MERLLQIDLSAGRRFFGFPHYSILDPQSVFEAVADENRVAVLALLKDGTLKNVRADGKAKRDGAGAKGDTIAHRLAYYKIEGVAHRFREGPFPPGYKGVWNLRNANGDTPMLAAVRMRNTAVVQDFLTHGISVHYHVKDADGLTVLHIATENRDATTLQRLLSWGVSPDMPDAEGRTPLMLAVRDNWGSDGPVEGETNVYDVLRLAASTTPALYQGPTDIPPYPPKEILFLARDHKGWTALHHAAEVGSLKWVRKLIADGAPVDPKDLEGRRPIDVAREGNHLSVVQYLEALAPDRTSDASSRGAP